MCVAIWELERQLVNDNTMLVKDNKGVGWPVFYKHYFRKDIVDIILWLKEHI